MQEQLASSLCTTFLSVPTLCTMIIMDIKKLRSNIHSSLHSDPIASAQLDSPSPHWSINSKGFLLLNDTVGMLTSWDPCPIAEILPDPRSIPYRSSNSVPTILQYSDTTLTKTPNSKYPPNPPTHFLSLSKLRMTSENPDHISVFLCLHCSILVLSNSEYVFMSSSQFSPFCFRYIKPFQYSHSLILASALPLYISASLLLNSSNSL